MRIFVFGNPDLETDSLPIKILPKLKKKFPEYTFLFQDPNEEWDTSKPFWVIDTVVGLKEIMLFDSLKHFIGSPRMSMHDFDALTNLRFLEKLGKLPKIKIVGLPPTISENKAMDEITKLLVQIHPS